MSNPLPPPRQNGNGREMTSAQETFAKLRRELNSEAFRKRVAGAVPAEFRTVGYVDRLCESIFIACRDSVANGRPGTTLLDCDRASLFRAAERIAKKGLTVGDNVAWLVPYKGQVQDQLGYKGAMILVRRSGQVKRISAQPVFEADTCEIMLGSEQTVKHRPAMTGDRGRFLGVYAIAWIDEDPEIEWMSVSDVEKIRQNAPSRDSPAWKGSYSEMARAKVLKRLCKRLPTERQIDLDDIDEAASQTIEGTAETVDFDAAQPAEMPTQIEAPTEEEMDTSEVVIQPHNPETGELAPEPAQVRRQAPPPRTGRARDFTEE